MKLIDVVVNPDNILNTSVLITLDLSKLSELWITMETLITYLRQRIKECIKEASKTNPKVKERIKKSIRERVNNNVDEAKLEPLALPTAIICTKYDIFETYEPEKQKIISKTLRFVAHYFGASLIFSSYKNETTISRLKNLLNHFLLDDSLAIKQPQVDHLKPIFVPFGTDTMEAIGRPPLNASELNDPNHK
jgi:dynein light intermediate chain 2